MIMMATIYMKFDGDENEYMYGVYAFNTPTEKNKVNELAMNIRRERNCSIRIAENKQNI